MKLTFSTLKKMWSDKAGNRFSMVTIVRLV